MQSSEQNTLNVVKQYYSEKLTSNKDLQTNACCTGAPAPKYVSEVLSHIHPEILDKFYGCGSPIPEALSGCTVLDLGCGTGRDCFVLSKLVGESGKIIGVDMTQSQLSVARQHEAYQMQQFGFSKSNVEFRHGYIEDLAEAEIEDSSIDIVVSNCVINLSPNKAKVFDEIFRVLKPGGELFFSDVFTTSRIPEDLRNDPILLGECLGGAMYIEDFRRMLLQLGCADFRVVSSAKLKIDNADIETQVGDINFCSLTIRAFKLPLEDRCEDFGQVAYYLGTMPESPTKFTLDDHHVFIKDKPMLVCGNTADMLSSTRFAKHFRVVGDKSKHFGLFDCSVGTALQEANAAVGGCC